MMFFSARVVTWLRRLGAVLVAVLLLWSVAWALVPPLLKSQAQTRLTALLGRAVTIGAVEFKPWSLELTLHDVAVATQDGQGVQFSVGRVYVNGSAESLLRLAPVVDAVRVDAPYVQLRYAGAGHYDVDDIVQRLAQPSAPETNPLQFAIYNVTLKGGSVDFIDASEADQTRQHTLRDVQLSIPFLSNFNSQREVLVEPHLAFVLNGSAFDSAAKGTPFAQTRKGEAQLTIKQLDLKPYLPYWPVGLPVQLHGAVLDAALKVAFVQQPQTALSISGDLTVHQLALADATGAPLLTVDSVRATLQDVQPLAQRVHVSALDLSQPHLQLRRESHGRLNIDASSPTRPKSARPGGRPPDVGSPSWSVAVDHLDMHDGQVDWQDMQAPAKLTLAAVDVKAQDLHWPMDKNAQADVSATVPGSPASARVDVHAQGTDQQGQLQLRVKDASLALANPYLAAWLEPRVRGVMDATVALNWRAGQLQANLSRVAVRDGGLERGAPAEPGKVPARSKVVAGNNGMPSFKLLDLRDTTLDLGKRTLQLGKLLLQQPSFALQRAADGQWMFTHWRKPSTDASDARANATAGAPWNVTLGELSLQDGRVQFADRVNERAVQLAVSALNVQAQGAQIDGKRPVPLRVSAQVASGDSDGGTLRFQGSVAWAPEVALQGHLQLQELPAHALAPYVASQVNVDVVRADASFDGKVRFSTAPNGPTLALQGDAVLEDFRANTVPGVAGSFAEELLSWKSLNLPGVDVALAPDTATHVAVREAALSDFYARIVVAPTGRLNLQDLLKPRAQAQAPSVPVPVPVITMGPISLVNGKVLFSDRFIQPNYTADLSDLTGRLGAFSSEPSKGAVQLADLELRGRAEGTASLDIAGKLNPLATPLALDIAGKVRELELPPLSPYAIKYAGYGITRGKLSMDVHYAVQPDGQLTATNKLVLNQLSFGDKAEGSTHSLPVKLAAALLADRNGVIDLDLPISGSLNDPEFRVGPVIWKVLGNVISKAVTAPFSLLAHALGGDNGADLHAVAFDPGSAALTPTAQAGLDKLAQVLVERPSLQLTVVGKAQLQRESEAMQREQLRVLLLAEKRRQASAQGKDVAAVNGYSDAEMPVLLREVYRRADIPKPRNLLGLSKDLPVPDMEALLLTNIRVNEDSARELALQRGVAVRDYLAAHGVGVDRLFLGAVNTGASAEEAPPQAELSLAN